MITFTMPPTVLILGLILSTVLPLLVALVTRRLAAPGLKAVVLAALAAVTGLLTELVDALRNGTPYDVGMGLLTALAAFLVAVGLHYGLWKPTGLTGSKGRIATAVPGGLGSDADAVRVADLLPSQKTPGPDHAA